MLKPILISIIFSLHFFNVVFAQFTSASTVLDNFNLTTTCKTSIESLVDDKVINKCLPMFTIITSIPALLPSSQKDPKSKIDITAQLIRETCLLPKCSSSLLQNTALTLKDNCPLDLSQQNIMATLNLLLFTHYEPIRELSCKRNHSSTFNSYCILETLVNIGTYENPNLNKRHGNPDGAPKTNPTTTSPAADPTVSAAGTAADNNPSNTPPQSGENPGSSTPSQDGENSPSQSSSTPSQDGENPPSQSSSTPPQDGENPPPQSSATPTQGGQNPPSQGSASAPSYIPSQGVESTSSQSISSFFKTLVTLPNSIICTDCNKAMVSVVMNYLKENPTALNDIQIQPTLMLQGSQALKLKCGDSFLNGTTPNTISSSSRLLHSYFYNFIEISIITILLLLL